ncbi:T-cell surface glycoprotein CD8 alpha chain-like [Pseudophryne corroboree]|uniref:T-cell surface glycoprotein CD8 alpha chain-like n=1 Tax=Pseudophryne corroboree TaxID=495146 RepID=UPI0030821BA0
MVCHIMAALISPLMLLCLFSCSQQLKLKGPEVTSGFSGPVRLECEPDRGDFMDFGVFWFRQRKDAENPESIVFLSVTKRKTYSDQNKAKHFLPNKTGSAYTLTIQSFNQTDQGTYYCMINKNSVLLISPGLPLLYPEATQAAKTEGMSGDAYDCSSRNTAKRFEFMVLSCDPYVWGPLTGLCCLLLICLLVTSTMLSCNIGQHNTQHDLTPQAEKQPNHKMCEL